MLGGSRTSSGLGLGLGRGCGRGLGLGTGVGAGRELHELMVESASGEGEGAGEGEGEGELHELAAEIASGALRTSSGALRPSLARKTRPPARWLPPCPGGREAASSPNPKLWREPNLPPSRRWLPSGSRPSPLASHGSTSSRPSRVTTRHSSLVLSRDVERSVWKR